MSASWRFHRVVIVAVSLSVAALGAPLFADEALPGGEALMDKFVEATGGKAAYDKIDNRVSKINFAMPAAGFSMELTVYAAKPNKMYMMGESPAMGKHEEGTDGETAWEVSAMNGARYKEGPELADTLRRAIFDANAYWRDVYSTVETVGVETIDEVACYKVVATPADGSGSPQTLYFEQESGLLVQVETVMHHTMGDIPITSRLADYQEVDGIKIPFTNTSSMMGQEQAITLQSVEHNVDMPADRFAVPEEVQELLEIPEATRAED